MWKAIQGYEGYYEVSDLGEVRSVDRVIPSVDGRQYRRRGKIMKQSISKSRNVHVSGYPVVNLHKQHHSLVVSVHQLVARAFIPNPLNLPTVNHRDGNKLNNASTNLEWASYSANNIHALESQLRQPRSNPVVQESVAGKIIAFYDSVSKASRVTGVSRGMISHCIHHRARTAGGYVWEKYRKV